MKKQFLLLFLLLTGVFGLANAENYVGETTPMPESANISPAPGTYTELVGTYMADLTSSYVNIYSNVFQRKEAWVVNADNEIVCKPAFSVLAAGARSGNLFQLTIPEAEKITEKGEYWLIFPTSLSPDVTAQAQDATNGQLVEIYNLKAGPYIVGEVKESVDAIVSVAPQGQFQVSADNNKLTVIVKNAVKLNVLDLDNVVLVIDDKYANEEDPSFYRLQMEPGEINGNVMSWEFPYENGVPAQLPDGNYTIYVDFSNVSGLTAEGNPLKFPAETQEYQLLVGDPTPELEYITPAYSVTSPYPNPPFTTLESINALMLKLADSSIYTFKNTSGVKAVTLEVTNPAGKTFTIPYGRGNYGNIAFNLKAEGAEVNMPGVYKAVCHFNGTEVTEKATGIDYLFNDIEVEFTLVADPETPIDAQLTLTPQGTVGAPGSEVKLTVDNANYLHASNLDILTMTNAEGAAVELGAGAINGNTVTWALPEGGLAEGEYTLSLNAAGFYGLNAEYYTLTFPTEPQQYNLTVKTPKIVLPVKVQNIDVDQQLEATSLIGQGVILPLVGYKFVDITAAKSTTMTMTNPNGETFELALFRTNVTSLSFKINAELAPYFSESGEYKCVVDPNGGHGINTDTKEEVVFEPYEFNLTIMAIAAPSIKVNDMAQEGEAYVIPKGKSVAVVLETAEEAAEGTVVMYKWTPAAQGEVAAQAEEGFAAYTEPLEINEAGTLEYYSSLPIYNSSNTLIGTAISATKKMEFTVSTTTGVEGIEAADSDAQARYYNLNGVRVNPTQPGLYIMVKDDKATKITVK